MEGVGGTGVADTVDLVDTIFPRWLLVSLGTATWEAELVGTLGDDPAVDPDPEKLMRDGVLGKAPLDPELVTDGPGVAVDPRPVENMGAGVAVVLGSVNGVPVLKAGTVKDDPAVVDASPVVNTGVGVTVVLGTNMNPDCVVDPEADVVSPVENMGVEVSVILADLNGDSKLEEDDPGSPVMGVVLVVVLGIENKGPELVVGEVTVAAVDGDEVGNFIKEIMGPPAVVDAVTDVVVYVELENGLAPKVIPLSKEGGAARV